MRRAPKLVLSALVALSVALGVAPATALAAEVPVNVTGKTTAQERGQALIEAVNGADAGDTILLSSGEYDVTATRAGDSTYGSGLIIGKSGITIKATDDSDDKPVIYGFTNKYSAGTDDDGINGQDTIYVSGSGVTLENLTIMPLGGYRGGDGNTYVTKTVEVTATATDFKMTGCETTPNTYKKDDMPLDNAEKTNSGNIHVSINDADITGNSFGAGTTISAGWVDTDPTNTYTVDVSQNYWAGVIKGADLAYKIDGNVVIDTYYTNAEMTTAVKVGGIPVSDGTQLRAAVIAAKEGDTIIVYPGEYDIEPGTVPTVQGQGNWYLPITANNITIRGVDEGGNPITDAMETKASLYSTTETQNGSWASQSLISVFGNNVTISGVTIMPKVQVNKTVEVNGENFTIQYCSIVPNTKVTEGGCADNNDGGSLYFAGDKGTEVVRGNYFKQMVLSFDSVDMAESILVENNVFDTPYNADTQMISNVTWTNPSTLKMADVTIKENTFKNLPDAYTKLVLQRMGGTFILEDNDLVKADDSTDDRKIVDMVTFDGSRYYEDNWNNFVEANPRIVVIADGATITLVPSEMEDGDDRSLSVSASSKSIYAGTTVTLTATAKGFTDPNYVWSVNSQDGCSLNVNGSSATFSASVAGEYTVTVQVGGVSASCTIVVQQYAPAPDPTPEGEEVVVEEAENGTVEFEQDAYEAGEEVTFSVEPDEGYVVSDVTVTDAEGNEVEVTANGDGTYSFEMPEGGVTVAAEFAPELPFSDVEAGEWFYGPVAYVYANGLMTGYEGTALFGPEDALFREQAATVLWRALGAGEHAGDCGLPDVAQSEWYAQPVNWAVETGLIAGYADGSGLFGVGDALTRDQFAAIVARVAKADLSQADPSALDAFSDGGEVAEWAVPAVSWAAETGILEGSPDGQGGTELRAGAKITRGEMAAMIMRAAEAGLLPTA